MARPREFDYDDVLNAAMQAFWARGYEATSVHDLMSATGLQKGSLYKAFGDKHSLFLKALEAYLEKTADDHMAVLDPSLSPRQALETYLHEGIRMLSGEDGGQGGCFAINSVVELAPHDPQVRDLLMEHYAKKREVFVELIGRGQTLGEIRKDRSAEDLASTFLTLLFGMVLSLRGGVPTEQAHTIADTVVELFG